MPETSAKTCGGNIRIKYNLQYKDGRTYLSLNNIHDEDTALRRQSHARNVSLNSRPVLPPTSLISETTKQLARETGRCHHRTEEAAKASLSAIAYVNHDTRPWKEQPIIGGPLQFVYDTRMTDDPSFGDGTPENPVTSDQSRKRRRGRPPGSKNKPKPDPSVVTPEKRKRGRPIGSKNKPKMMRATPAEATGAPPTPSVRTPLENNIEQNETPNHNGSNLDDNEQIYHQNQDFTSNVWNRTRPQTSIQPPASIQEPGVEWRPIELLNVVHNSPLTVWSWTGPPTFLQEPSLVGWRPMEPTSVVQDSSPMLWSLEKSAGIGQGVVSDDRTSIRSLTSTISGSEESNWDPQTPSARDTLDVHTGFDAMDGVMPKNMTALPDLESTTSSGSIPSPNGELSTPPNHHIEYPIYNITNQILAWLVSHRVMGFVHSDTNC